MVVATPRPTDGAMPQSVHASIFSMEVPASRAIDPQYCATGPHGPLVRQIRTRSGAVPNPVALPEAEMGA
ncbi:hypothetical protein Psuf_008290 [Phytohabitans suffuscus]|uniref:Uncharacterized protein n=1 Tax=Phytohabitans suffuscus TaxID=624315 RepID=A0A6F8YBP5_9ACTN|nr:hypothetical protein Psuf_008290 [Phytohabitans suffuscus]